MAKGYLSPAKLLSKKEYKEYKEQQQTVRRVELQRKLAAGKKNIEQFEKQRRYAKSRTGKLGSFISKGFSLARPDGITTALYNPSIPITSQNVQQQYPSRPKQTLRGSSGGKVGRPKATYDKRYAAYGGVYGYRKFLAAKLRERRLELQRKLTVSPQQQMAINRLESQQRYQQLNPENKVIPDTYGQTPMAGFMNEIDVAANLVK